MVGTETFSMTVIVLPPISFVPTVVFSGPGVTSGSGMVPGHRTIVFGAISGGAGGDVAKATNTQARRAKDRGFTLVLHFFGIPEYVDLRKILWLSW
ncbi:MAG: hypothetical protein K2Q25_14590 [Mycobacteriaceae bacterium]|nr:hypothetical protein [Mycobacteriaceae bacterium]